MDRSNMDYGKHILVMIFTLLLFVPSSFSAEYQTLVPTLLPARQTELEALSWDTQSKSESESTPPLSLKLHHIDNIMSPLNSTSEYLFKNRLSRDALRANAISAVASGSGAAGFMSSPVTSGYALGSGEYFTRIGVGTPPKYLYMILDTGSDLIWLQCSPCLKCYEQVDPIFEPSKSTSFSGVLYGSSLCSLLHNRKCGRRKQCIFEEWYGDGSFVIGDFSTETLTFGETVMKKVALGCGHDNEGLFVAAAGLLGLGGGNLSFPGQKGNKFRNKFSYCLVNRLTSSNSSSHLNFGDSPAYRKAVYTPLVRNPKFETFYYVGMEGISVGGSRVQGINANMFRIDTNTGGGGVVIDSGTSVTRLTKHAYVALRDAFRNATSNLTSRPSNYSLFDTCYDLSGMKEVEVPTVDLHFSGGANMYLPGMNYLVPVDNNGTYCFAFAGTALDGEVSIIGNIQQQSFGMVFDLAKKRIGFAENSCT